MQFIKLAFIWFEAYKKPISELGWYIYLLFFWMAILIDKKCFNKTKFSTKNCLRNTICYTLIEQKSFWL